MMRYFDMQHSESATGTCDRVRALFRVVSSCGFSQALGANAAVIVVTFATSVLAARLLGPEKRGEVAAAIVFASVAQAIADVGVTQAVPYFAAKERERSPEILGTLLFLSAVAGVVAAAFGCLALLVMHLSAPATVVWLAATPFAFMATLLSVFMQGQGRIKSFNYIRVAQTATLTLALMVAIPMRIRSVPVISGIALALMMLTAANGAVAAHRIWPARHWRVSREIAGGLVRYGIKTYPGNLCWLLNSRLSQLAMSVFLPLSTLGVYVVAVSYSGLIFSLLGAFAISVYARAANCSPIQGLRVTRSFLRAAALVSVPTVVFTMLVSPRVIPIFFSSEFASAVAPALVLLVAAVFLGGNFILSSGLRAVGYPGVPSVGEGVGVVVSVVGLYWALPRFGMMGAAWVSLATYAATFLVLMWYLGKLMRANLPKDEELRIDAKDLDMPTNV